jgi:hypothetical protein
LEGGWLLEDGLKESPSEGPTEGPYHNTTAHARFANEVQWGSISLKPRQIFKIILTDMT